MEPAKCLAIIVCEGVVEDVRSHNKTIFNTFNAIWSRKYPATHDRLTVFVSLTNGRGTMELDVRFVPDQEGSVAAAAFGVKGKVTFADPLDILDLTLDLRNVPIPRPGTYAVQVWLNGTMIGERRIFAEVIAGGEK